MTSQNGARLLTFEYLTLSSLFPPQKDCPCSFLDSSNHFIEFSCILGDFWTILGHFGSMTSQNGSRFLDLRFIWLNQITDLKLLPLAHFNVQTITSSSLICVFGDFGTILSRFGGPWGHKRVQDFNILNFWHHRFSYP